MMILFLIILPLLTSLMLFAIRSGHTGKTIATIVSSILFFVSIFGGYEVWTMPQNGLTTSINLQQQLGIMLDFKMDGISILFVLLTTLLVPIIVASTYREEQRPSSFYALILLMQSSLIGVFTASNLLLFYIFWEFTLLPIFFITARWGGKNAKKISIKFLIYTIVGSFFMLVAILYLYTQTPAPHSFNFADIYQLHLSYSAQLLVFLAFALAFAIKIPLFPFHSWQPETYNASPVQGSMLLAGLMLKMGLYGIIRFLIPLAQQVIFNSSTIVLSIIIIGVLYGGVIAVTQPNLKKMIAFASLAHVALIAAGLFSNNIYGIEGGILQSFSHGVNIVGFFLCYAIIVKRTHTDSISQLGGIARQAPRFGIVFMIIMLANIALPLTNSFVGEFLILLGLFSVNKVIAVLAGLTIIIGAVYMLRMYQKVMYGASQTATEHFADLSWSEMLLFTPIILTIFLIGVYPSFVLTMLQNVVH
ncbi:MAG: complex I subunit 4 family protein [Microbacter sp.]